MIYVSLLLTSMLSIQIGASIAKALFVELGPIGLTLLRVFFASLILLIIYKPWRFVIRRSDLKYIVAYGCSLGAMNLLFYLSLERIPLGITVALEFIGPLAVAIFSSKKIKDILWVICAVTGIYLLLPLDTAPESLDPAGVAYALLAGLFWAMYILFGKEVATKFPSGIAISLGMLVAFFSILPFALFTSDLAVMRLNILPLGLVVAILSSALPYTLEMISLKHIPKQSFSIILSLAPAMAALSGLVFLNEQLQLGQYLAIAFIITASIGSVFNNVKKEYNKKLP